MKLHLISMILIIFFVFADMYPKYAFLLSEFGHFAI